MKQGELVRPWVEIPGDQEKEAVVNPIYSTAVSMMGLQLQLAMESFMEIFGNGGYAEMSSFWQSPCMAPGHAHCNTPFLVLDPSILLKTHTLSIKLLFDWTYRIKKLHLMPIYNLIDSMKIRN